MEDSWDVKQYPEEKKKAIDELIKKTSHLRSELDELDKIVSSHSSAPDPEIILDWARKASGLGNKLRKYHSKLASMARNEEATRFIEIKVECDNKGIKFVAGAAEFEASRYINTIRLARNILEAYVISSDNIISICRLHLGYSNSTRETDIQ